MAQRLEATIMSSASESQMATVFGPQFRSTTSATGVDGFVARVPLPQQQ